MIGLVNEAAASLGVATGLRCDRGLDLGHHQQGIERDVLTLHQDRGAQPRRRSSTRVR
jgi:hypothetical protein